MPSFQSAELDDAESKPDPFQPADYMMNKSGLKDFLRGVEDDNDAIETAARMPGASPDLKAEFADRKATEIAIAFKREAGGRYLATDANMDALVQSLSESVLGYSNMDSEQLVTRLQSAGFWTVEHLMEAFEALFDSGTLPDYTDGVYRPLRAEDWERIARLCQAGNADLALIWGLKQSLDLDNTSSFVFDNIIVQPHSRPMGAPLMPVRRSTNGYSISQRKRKRVEECFGSLKTIALLRKVRHRGVFKVGWVFTFAAAAYNLVRMRNLAIQAT